MNKILDIVMILDGHFKKFITEGQVTFRNIQKIEYSNRNSIYFQEYNNSLY